MITFNNNCRFQADFHIVDNIFSALIMPDCLFRIGFDNTINVPVADYYDGDYEVTPHLYSQGLPTQGLAMRDDVKIKEIPITYTSNIFDGKTVVIG